MINAIDEYIHNSKYREILKSRYIDGMTYEKIAGQYEISVTHVKNIIKRYGDKLLLKVQR